MLLKWACCFLFCETSYLLSVSSYRKLMGEKRLYTPPSIETDWISSSLSLHHNGFAHLHLSVLLLVRGEENMICPWFSLLFNFKENILKNVGVQTTLGRIHSYCIKCVLKILYKKRDLTSRWSGCGKISMSNI